MARSRSLLDLGAWLVLAAPVPSLACDGEPASTEVDPSIVEGTDRPPEVVSPLAFGAWEPRATPPEGGDPRVRPAVSRTLAPGASHTLTIASGGAGDVAVRAGP